MVMEVGTMEEEGENYQGSTPERGLANHAVSRHGINEEQVPGYLEEHKKHGHFQS